MLAYKTYKPDNKEICIVNIGADLPCKLIDLGEFEFVSFVKHTHMVNKKLFRKYKEDTIIFTILVRHSSNLRLISYKIKSAFTDQTIDSSQEGDSMVDKIYLFSGILT